MCGRYFIEISEQELWDIINFAVKDVAEYTFNGGEIFPGTVAPVITANGATFMKWGIPDYTGKRPYINSRSETAAASRTFGEAWAERRCVIPASGYYEWKAIDKKHKEKYAFTLINRETLYMAGIYSSAGQFAILTRDASPAIIEIHNRMPGSKVAD